MLSYKQSRRREDDLAVVNAGLRVVLVPVGEEVGEEEGREVVEVEGREVGEGGEGGEGGEERKWRVGECSLVYGGMSFKTVMATQTQQALIGK